MSSSRSTPPVFSAVSAPFDSVRCVTSPVDPQDAVLSQWWWEFATKGARQSGPRLQDAVTIALRRRTPRIVEVVRLEREHGLAAVTTDALIIAVDAGHETRTTEVPADQIVAVLQKPTHVVAVKCGHIDIELRAPNDELEAAIVALRAQTSQVRPEGPRHAVAPPSRPLATPQRLSEPVAHPDRRAALDASRRAAPIGMGSRRAHGTAGPEPERGSEPVPADVPQPRAASLAATSPSWDYVLSADGVWRRPPAVQLSAPASGGEHGLH